jgi:hypothetical protein
MAWARSARVPWWPTTVAPAQRAYCAARVPPAPSTPVYQHGDTGDRPVGVGQVAELQHLVRGTLPFVPDCQHHLSRVRVRVRPQSQGVA